MRRLFPIAVVVAAIAACAGPPSAVAGEYIVHACSAVYGDVNGSWSLSATAPLTGYACSKGSSWDRGLVTRLNPREGSVPMYTGATYTFTAPAGTSLEHMEYDRAFCGGLGFRAGLWTPASGYQDMAGPGCSSQSHQDLPLFGASQVHLTTQCAQTNCSTWTSSEIHGAMSNVRVYVNDPTPPSVSLAGGTIKTTEWQSGIRTAVIAASDSTGISQVAAYSDGSQAGAVIGTCDFTRTTPCSTPATPFAIDTRILRDGAHALRVDARDSSGNTGAASMTVYVDNTAPGSPLDPRLEGPTTWRTSNDFTAVWTNPPHTNTAPIVTVRWLLCPGATPSSSTVGCRAAGATALNISRVAHLQVPGVGQWQLRLWLGDRAGNHSPGTARTLWLRFDNLPPAVRIADPDPMDPQRLTVMAADQNAGVGRVDIEIRRQGTDAWISLPVTPTPAGFTTMVDDASLPDGVYDVRARAIDRAGNERTTTVRASGAAAHLSLPLRIPTALNAGGVRVVRGRHGKRREVLVSTATAPYGRRVTIRGRLTTAGGNPLTNTDVDVLERTDLPDQPWVRVGIVRTGANGGFTYTALRGPSRAVRFSYAGTALIRPQAADVNVRVRAKTSIDVSRRSVVNGDEVVFRGRVRGGPMPSTGKLLQLQAYSRGGWRTFATPRASARTHKWRYGYRFTATRGTVRYRFRALVPLEGGFPFVQGASRSLKVLVHGL
jgi:hypothetical protein